MRLVSIIIPVYYNAPSLPLLAQKLDTLSRANPQYGFEFIYVDDGSGDDSLSILYSLASRDNRISVVKLSRNFGSNNAILAGMTVAKGDCVGFIAADIQDPPEAFTEMIRLWQQGTKVVFAVRKDRKGDPLITRLFSYIFNYLFKRLVFNSLSPQGIGFFLIDRQVNDVIIKCEEKNPHVFGLILWTGFSYVTVQYDREERQHGKSRWTFQKKLKYFIDAFVAFSYLPIRITSALGLILASLGGIYAVIVLVARFTHQIPVEGWTALMVVFLVLSGVQLIMLGIIGEYLWRNFDATRHRPAFIIEKCFTGEECKISKNTSDFSTQSTNSDENPGMP
jgi:glycosyltransferase involved in cell wall biosynthesis